MPSGAYRIFVVPANGGGAIELQPQGQDQGVPTWSPDDTSILFGERIGRRPPTEMCLHTLDLNTREIGVLNGTAGLWSPRRSPVGNRILAVTTDNHTIRVLDTPHWRDVVSMKFVDNVTWSYDSRYIYFNGRVDDHSPFAVYRVNADSGTIEKLVDLKAFRMPLDNWFGVSPDGVLLASKDYPHQEICELRCSLP
jgi:Tol biopolymer transport system component